MNTTQGVLLLLFESTTERVAVVGLVMQGLGGEDLEGEEMGVVEGVAGVEGKEKEEMAAVGRGKAKERAEEMERTGVKAERAE